MEDNSRLLFLEAGLNDMKLESQIRLTALLERNLAKYVATHPPTPDPVSIPPSTDLLRCPWLTHRGPAGVSVHAGSTEMRRIITRQSSGGRRRRTSGA